jgi:hypothetical protein
MSDVALTIEHAADATEADAAAVLSDVFDKGGDYIVSGPTGMFGVNISAPAAAARDALTLWNAIFPVDGHYIVKAKLPEDEPPPIPKRLPRWWLESLLSDATQHAITLRSLFVERVTDLVRQYGGALTTPEARMALEALLMDFRLAVKWSLGQPLPAAVERRLRAMGFRDDEIIRFPGLAYRLGMIEAELAKRPDMPLAEILRIARAVPLNPADEIAIAHAAARAGDVLTPVLVRDAERTVAQALEYERSLLRTMTAAAVKKEMGAREFARTLYYALSPEGVVRDFDRVARTELHEARVRGAFAADEKARGWTPETQVFRTVAAVPCNVCLTLYKADDGMPRLYTVEALEADDAKGYNRGPVGSWHARIGATHPNCLCSPWVKWWPEMTKLYEPERAKWLATFKRRGLA